MFSSLPPLIVVNCGDPGTPSHGIREPDPVATQLSNVVKYSCDEGYELLGSQERTCQSSGEWSGQLPTCQSELATAVVQIRRSVPIAYSPSVVPLVYVHRHVNMYCAYYTVHGSWSEPLYREHHCDPAGCPV